MRNSSKTVGTAAIVAAGAGLACLVYRQNRDREDALLHVAASEIVKSIASVMGVVTPPLRVTREVSNAAANAREIAINPEWLSAAMQSVCSDAGCHYNLAVGILAHELAHVVYQDAFAPLWAKEAIELRADGFAGAALARLGLDDDAFGAIIWRISHHHSAGPTGYPSRVARVEAIRRGYALEQQQIAAELNIAANYLAGRTVAMRFYGLAA